LKHRVFGRTGWKVSEIGFGTWGMGGWSGSDDEESLRALGRAIELGCSFFDTAWVYGSGRSERLLGEARRMYPHAPMFIATKVPPRNMRWPASREDDIAEVYPGDHIREYTEKSLANLDVDVIDLQQFHVWSDAWASDPGWQRAVRDLKDNGLVRAFGISVNRWEPVNGLRALDTGLLDAVQVVYNIFDQAPEDELFPYCREHDIAVIARVPFDEGSLTGSLTPGAAWPEGDWRNVYFSAENLGATLARVDRLTPIVPRGMTLPEVALRFVLEDQTVATTIPGMRRVAHVESNLAVSDGRPLPAILHQALRSHRWDRVPAWHSA
jgi:aryl-alcohol dehydrogenase-like predicted oxidoreductase